MIYYFVIDVTDDDEADPIKPDKNEIPKILRTLSAKMEDLNTCSEMIGRHWTALQRAIVELEQLDASCQDMPVKVKTLNERATLYRITSNAMINVRQTSPRRANNTLPLFT